eukprot:TRINITY_DN4852_c1_g1_i1.p1 TRINITY_DN4852_c1_g1~~TRINITY_DN4852_c1_g1_i1.p1  ORF type:complete len:269 (+),score=35.15 TRINITY_DN4852_c1_g1_i1:53-808(+)
MQSLCIFTPFIAFQAYGYFNICRGSLSDDLRPWCKTRVPLLYDFLQSHYWGVGFLKYFQVKQLPNFLLASPVLSLAVYSVIRYAKLCPEIVFSLGFRATQEEKGSAVFYHLREDQRAKGVQVPEKSSSSNFLTDPTLRRRKKIIKGEASGSFLDPLPSGDDSFVLAKQGYASILVLPFVLHLGFMSTVAFFVMHVQVATRFLSASPPLYWSASYLIVSPSTGRRWGYLIYTYFAAYILLGSLLFSNFYPFT